MKKEDFLKLGGLRISRLGARAFARTSLIAVVLTVKQETRLLKI